MLGIVVSRADRASEHVGERLLDLADWDRIDAGDGAAVAAHRTDGAELREFEGWHLELDDTADAFDAELELLAFASRHSGETGPLLTAHHTGNFGPAEHGGEDDALARACPHAHSRVLDALESHAPEDYDVGMECTHHGPTDVGVPSMFVEVGSGDPQWEDPAAAEAVARAILDLRGVAPDAEPEPVAVDAGPDAVDGTRRHVVGFGGGHYAPRFTRIVRETDWGVGHLAADWGLEAMGDPGENRALIDRAFEASAADHAVVEGDRPDLVSVIDELGYRVVGETWLREVTGVPLALAGRLEDALVSVSDGLRFGDPASEAATEGDFEIVALPEDLIDRAQGIDQARTRELVAGHALAFETAENGNRVAGRTAVASSGDYEAIIDGIVDLLRTEYDAVERHEDAVIARQERFDPEKAETLGVSEGPKFGRLSAGEPVEVNGRTIPPEQVRSEREDRFPL